MHALPHSTEPLVMKDPNLCQTRMVSVEWPIPPNLAYWSITNVSFFLFAHSVDDIKHHLGSHKIRNISCIKFTIPSLLLDINLIEAPQDWGTTKLNRVLIWLMQNISCYIKIETRWWWSESFKPCSLKVSWNFSKTQASNCRFSWWSCSKSLSLVYHEARPLKENYDSRV